MLVRLKGDALCEDGRPQEPGLRKFKSSRSGYSLKLEFCFTVLRLGIQHMSVTPVMEIQA